MQKQDGHGLWQGLRRTPRSKIGPPVFSVNSRRYIYHQQPIFDIKRAIATSSPYSISKEPYSISKEQYLVGTVPGRHFNGDTGDVDVRGSHCRWVDTVVCHKIHAKRPLLEPLARVRIYDVFVDYLESHCFQKIRFAPRILQVARKCKCVKEIFRISVRDLPGGDRV
jgi:hypothetical protein